MQIAICPNCKKEIPPDTRFCHHCQSPIVSVSYKEIFSWPWQDKILLLAFILVVIAFFQPWFPGSILYEEKPLSAFRMLLNINDLEIDFLESYNILRMALMVPLLSFFLFIMVYLRRSIQDSIFPPLFLLVVIGITFIPLLLKTCGVFWGILLSLILLAGVLLYFKNAFRRGRLAGASHFALMIFMGVSVFLYQIDLIREFYLKAEELRFSDTYGFWVIWIIFGVLILVLTLSFLKTVEDFWLLLAGIILSLAGYHVFINPLFLSGPFAFFADNLRIVGEHTVTHIEVVAIAQVIAIASGVPIGVYITRNPTAAGIVLYLTSIIITIPSIAMFGLMMPILSSIDRAWDAVNGIGIGKVPAIIALAFYSQLPIIRNTYLALKGVDPATIEAGRGMGMTRFQLLIQLQLPLSAPVIMAGVRTAVVMSVAIAAVAAYIGAGGLGLFVSEGLQLSTNNSVIVGAMSMAALAIVADILLGKAEDWITPAGLKIGS